MLDWGGMGGLDLIRSDRLQLQGGGEREEGRSGGGIKRGKAEWEEEREKGRRD